ncbi:MAG: C40 family peptidase [Bacteroidales bacterium]|nr:C40 family peptidase [Bacteroidales bacterium]
MRSCLTLLSWFVLTLSLVSCRGLIEHIRERQRATHEARTHATYFKQIEQKWGVKLPPQVDRKFIEEIDSWLGVPYKYGSNTKQGTDCSGMIQQIYKTVYGIDLERSAAGMQKNVDFIPLERAQLGDILFFKIDFKKVSHVGLYLGDRKFIHATTSKGVIISSLDEKYYQDRFFQAGKIKGLR